MPWRKTRDPYAIWLSEVMLQQTQVATVIPYYTKFLTLFPDIKSLANADISAVLGLWAGLGYYRRAHQLHRAACEIMLKHGGRLPTRFNDLLQLPGFGPYTAGAVASIAFDERVPAVDGNVLRVMARILADPHDILNPKVQRQLRETAQSWLPPRHAGTFNQAMMELGATVCTAGQPHCTKCPVSGVCRSRQAGTTADYPVRGKKDDRRRIYYAAVFAVLAPGLVLMAQRPSDGLWAGLWELPSLSISGPSQAEAAKIIVPLMQAAGMTFFDRQPVAVINHTLTHREITVCIFAGHLSGRRKRCSGYKNDAKAGEAMVATLQHGPLAHYAALRWEADPRQLPLSVLAKKQLVAIDVAEWDFGPLPKL